MQRITEAVNCALCHMPASRWALQQRSDGHMYNCPVCGGRYSIGTAALTRANDKGVPAALLGDVRRVIARGDLPRVGRIASDWQIEVVGRQDGDADL